MALKAERVDTWAASVEDHPGGLATKLNALAGAGVNLEFVISRRAPEKPGTGVLFVTPIVGPQQSRVAKEMGFAKTASLQTVRVAGPNKAGYGVNIAEAIAAQGINLRGFTAAAIGNKFVAYLALDKANDVAKALRILRRM
jgi:hypothetical protein